MIGSVECYAGFLYFMYICISGDIPPCLRIMQHPVNPCHFKLSQGTHTHTQTLRQTCKLNTDTYDSAHTQTHKTLEPVGNPGGRKLRVTQWRKHRRQGNEMLKQEENFMLSTTCSNMSEMHAHTLTHSKTCF